MRRLLPLVSALLCTSVAWANATLFVQEPYGLFGAVNPTGHTAIYFSRICAETPVVLRRCSTGETGIVISRYRKISGYDWIAIPLIPYLYAVESFEDAPQRANSDTVASLRDEYRRKHLRELVPDGPRGQTPKGSWKELIGAAYNRRIYGFQIETSEAQDDHLILVLNSHKNESRFNLFFNNCADFSRHLLNRYYSTGIRRNYIGDLGMTTPLQLAKSLVVHAKHHQGPSLSIFFIQQVPDSRQPSHTIEGVAEGLVRSKKYILPLAALHPWIAGAIVAVYLGQGRFNLTQYAETAYGPKELMAILPIVDPAGR
jgi:hypothetical protein